MQYAISENVQMQIPNVHRFVRRAVQHGQVGSNSMSDLNLKCKVEVQVALQPLTVLVPRASRLPTLIRPDDNKGCWQGCTSG